LAVINALPIPVLDGGHVMYYLWEWVTGRAPSPAWLAHSQRVGIALIAALMVVAVSNDFARLWG
jgi:regulator of sigma E protease